MKVGKKKNMALDVKQHRLSSAHSEMMAIIVFVG